MVPNQKAGAGLDAITDERERTYMRAEMRHVHRVIGAQLGGTGLKEGICTHRSVVDRERADEAAVALARVAVSLTSSAPCSSMRTTSS